MVPSRILKFMDASVDRIAWPYPAVPGSLVYWRAYILLSMLTAGLVLGAIALIAALGTIVGEKAWGLALMDGGCFATCLLLLFSRRIPYPVRTFAALMMLFAVGLAVLLSVGPLSGACAWLFAFPVLVGVLLGAKPALAAVFLNAVSLSVVSWLISTGRIGLEGPFFKTTEAMIGAGVNFIALNVLAVVAVATLVRGLVATHEKERALSSKLSRERTQLIKAKRDLELQIRERRSTETALAESEERYRNFIENAPMAMYTVNPRGEFTYGNRKLMEITGYRLEDWLHRPFHPIVHPDDLDTVVGRFQQRIRGEGNPDPYEIRIFHASGKPMWVEIVSKAILSTDASGRTRRVGMQVFVNDVTAKKKNERALRENEERFRTLVEASPLGIALIGGDGAYKYVNPRFEEMFGYTRNEVPTGREWFVKAFPDRKHRREVFEAWIDDLKQSRAGRARPRTYEVTCGDGSCKTIHFRPVAMENGEQLVIYEDITEQSRMQQQLQQVQKFKAIGTLAGGIAHDFNNLLMGIQGRASLISVDLDPSHPQMENVRAVEEYVRSATGLTRQLLGIARGGKYEVSAFDVNELVLKSADMFGRTRKEIRIRTRLAEPPPVIEADRRQIEQVLLNLYVNAWQAMPEGGELFLETAAVVLDAACCESYAADPGAYARISVTDTGHGMDDAVRNRIFDPFFTTREKGRGTGLGLASAYGIIKNHAGIITVYSEPRKGSTFNLFLPLSSKTAVREIPVFREPVRGRETILLIDDEEMIISVGRAMLERLGYRVVTADGGRKGVSFISGAASAVDLVILDLVMPEFDGGRTFDGIRKIRPDIPVILSSGYAADGQAAAVLNKGCNGFIQKPFSISELSHCIRRVLDGARGRPAPGPSDPEPPARLPMRARM